MATTSNPGPALPPTIFVLFGATGDFPNARGASRYHIIDGVKASLKRLQLDHVDLY